MAFKVPQEGMKFGCSDGGPPEKHSPEKLSRIHDVLVMVEQVLGHEAALKQFRDLSHSMKMDYSMSKWAYVSKK